MLLFSYIVIYIRQCFDFKGIAAITLYIAALHLIIHSTLFFLLKQSAKQHLQTH